MGTTYSVEMTQHMHEFELNALEREVDSRLKEINDKGTTVIVATHDYNIIKKFPSHTFVCENRSLVETNIENL